MTDELTTYDGARFKLADSSRDPATYEFKHAGNGNYGYYVRNVDHEWDCFSQPPFWTNDTIKSNFDRGVWEIVSESFKVGDRVLVNREDSVTRQPSEYGIDGGLALTAVVTECADDLTMKVKFDHMLSGGTYADQKWWIEQRNCTKVPDVESADPNPNPVVSDVQLDALRARIANGGHITEAEAVAAQAKYNRVVEERDNLSTRVDELADQTAKILRALCEVAENGGEDLPSFSTGERMCESFDAWVIRNLGYSRSEVEEMRDDVGQSREVEVEVTMSYRVSIPRGDVDDHDAVWEAVSAYDPGSSLIDSVTVLDD